MTMQTRDVAAIILLNKNKEVLLQKKDLGFKYWPGYWCFFGGGISGNEDPEQTICREVKEEIGYDVRTLQLFMVQEYQEEHRRGKKYIFVAPFDKRLADIRLKEGGGFAFFAFSELNTIKIIDHDHDALLSYFKEKHEKVY